MSHCIQEDTRVYNEHRASQVSTRLFRS